MTVTCIEVSNCQSVTMPNLALNDFEKAFNNMNVFKAKLVENGFNFDRREDDEYQASEVWKYSIMRYNKSLDKDILEWIFQVQIAKQSDLKIIYLTLSKRYYYEYVKNLLNQVKINYPKKDIGKATGNKGFEVRNYSTVIYSKDGSKNEASYYEDENDYNFTFSEHIISKK